MDALFTDFSHGGGSAHFELALFAELGATASCFAAFVFSFACDSLLVDEGEKENYQCQREIDEYEIYVFVFSPTNRDH